MNFLILSSQLRNPVAAILSVVLTSYLAFIHETGINPYIHQKLQEFSVGPSEVSRLRGRQKFPLFTAEFIGYLNFLQLSTAP